MAGLVLGVLGASGGIGATTLVGGLARVASRTGRGTVCIDARPFGGGLDVVLGLDEEPGLRWDHLRLVRGPTDGGELLDQLPQRAGVRVLSHGRVSPYRPPDEAVHGVFGGLSSAADCCLVDLPSVVDPGWTVLTAQLTDLLVLVGDGPLALSAAAALTPLLQDGSIPRIWLCQRVVRAHSELPNLVSEALGLPLAGVLRDDPKVGNDLRRGLMPGSTSGSFSRSCAGILVAMGQA